MPLSPLPLRHQHGGFPSGGPIASEDGMNERAFGALNRIFIAATRGARLDNEWLRPWRILIPMAREMNGLPFRYFLDETQPANKVRATREVSFIRFSAHDFF
jgi:hypothetical protein